MSRYEEKIKKVLRMDEYIKREAVLEIVNKLDDMTALVVGRKVMNLPAADVALVRHGRWERIGIKGRKGLPIYPCCSACGMVSAAYRSEWEGLRGAWKFCPNCGAKMDGGAENAR